MPGWPRPLGPEQWTLVHSGLLVKGLLTSPQRSRGQPSPSDPAGEFSLGLEVGSLPIALARPQLLQTGSSGLNLWLHHLGGLGRPGSLSEPHFPHWQHGYNHIHVERQKRRAKSE